MSQISAKFQYSTLKQGQLKYWILKMKRETIAIDVDDVTLDFTPMFLRFYNENYGTNFIKGSVRSYHLEEVLGVTKEKLIQIMHRFHESSYLTQIEPVIYSQEALRILNQKRNNVFVTSRPIAVKTKTNLSLSRAFENHYSGIFYSKNFLGDNGKTK